jgi:hypothetical protein
VVSDGLLRLLLVFTLLGVFAMPAHGQTASSRPRLPLVVQPVTVAVCRLPAGTPVPEWAAGASSFLTVSRTPEELSITADQLVIPADVRCERDYRPIRVRGTLPPDLVGILLAIAEPLAAAGISIFAISTYDTDYVLVKARDLERAIAALERAGHEVTR